MTAGHAVADSRRVAVRKVMRALMKSLHSDQASAMVDNLGPRFAHLKQMAHRVSCVLLDRDSPGEGPNQAH
eukprot:10227048-Alexandrium_andersonii.AAC.1